MNAVFAHIQPSDTYYNLGDAVCCPALYLEGSEETQCITKIDSQDTRPLILGGGGLFMSWFEDWISEAVEKRRVIIWGAGLNYPPGDIPAKLVPALKKCALVGVRDRAFAKHNQFDYVPCASCLYLGFDQRTQPTHSTVVYRHGWSEPYLTEFPTMTNTDRNATFDRVVQFLGSAETVVTDSYHGAYWAMLLGRRVIIYKGDAMRFYTGLPHQPIFAPSEDAVRQFLHRESRHRRPEAPFLQLAREANQRFKARVKNII